MLLLPGMALDDRQPHHSATGECKCTYTGNRERKRNPVLKSCYTCMYLDDTGAGPWLPHITCGACMCIRVFNHGNHKFLCSGKQDLWAMCMGHANYPCTN